MKRVELDGEKLAKFVKETPKEKLEEMLDEALHENMYELCMKTLKEIDCDLKLTGKCKECYDYIADQFILNYISDDSILSPLSGKNMLTIPDTICYITDGIKSRKFYYTWKGLLWVLKYVEDGVKSHDESGIVGIVNKFHDSLERYIENMVNDSGISRKFWKKFLDCYFPKR